MVKQESSLRLQKRTVRKYALDLVEFRVDLISGLIKFLTCVYVKNERHNVLREFLDDRIQL